MSFPAPTLGLERGQRDCCGIHVEEDHRYGSRYFTSFPVVTGAVVEDEQRLALLTPQIVRILLTFYRTCVLAPIIILQREYLAARFHNIGSSMLKESKAQAAESVAWLQRALTLMDKVVDETAEGIPKSRVCVIPWSSSSTPSFILTNMMKISILRTLGLLFQRISEHLRSERRCNSACLFHFGIIRQG